MLLRGKRTQAAARARFADPKGTKKHQKFIKKWSEVIKNWWFSIGFTVWHRLTFFHASSSCFAKNVPRLQPEHVLLIQTLHFPDMGSAQNLPRLQPEHVLLNRSPSNSPGPCGPRRARSSIQSSSSYIFLFPIVNCFYKHLTLPISNCFYVLFLITNYLLLVMLFFLFVDARARRVPGASSREFGRLDGGHTLQIMDQKWWFFIGF